MTIQKNSPMTTRKGRSSPLHACEYHLLLMKENRFYATPGKRFRLKDYDPADTGNYKSHAHAKKVLEDNLERLRQYQDLLYSERSHSLLIVLQAMDAAGKDGTIKHVMSGVNPAGCDVHAFKQPSQEELDHDFLWRCYKVLPERGKIGIFNRSYYEEVLVTRVHPKFLDAQRLPDFTGPTEKFWKHRFESINDMEKHLVRNGTVILKFFLHLSKEEQAKRFLERIDDPAKNWKFSEADLEERLRWDDYMACYEDMINHTSTRHAGWYVVPADNKWFTHLCVSDIVVETLKGLKLKYPSVSAEQKERLQAAREALTRK